MNILLANLSKFSVTKKLFEYEVRISDSSAKKVEAYQTNESILRALASIDSLKKNSGIEKIVMLTSNEVINRKNPEYGEKTVYEYYSDIATELFPNATSVQIKIENEDNSPKDISELLDKICSEIQHSDSVYIDAAGGQRVIVNLIQLLTKILNYKGIKNPYTLYADIQNKPNFIGDTSEFQKMTKLADAFNEFMTTGKSRQLSSYYSQNMAFTEFNKLLDAMTEFSDRIQLGDIDNLEESIKKLDLCIKECEKITTSFDIGTVILKQFLPVIRKKLIGDLDGKVDYLKIIEWCVENNLIQQALTLFVEKIPVYLFDTRIITYSGNALEARKNFSLQKNSLSSNWESHVFYSEILEPKGDSLDELKKWLESETNPKSKNVIDAVKILKRMEKEWNNLSNFEHYYKYLVDKKQQSKVNDFRKFKKCIRSDEKIMYRLIGLEDESATDTCGKKFKAIEKIKSSDFNFGSFEFNASSNKIAEIYYAYIYVKMLRNRINHASSEEKFSVDQKNTLKEYGFDFEHFSVTAVRRNIKNALEIVKQVSVKNDKQVNCGEEKTTEPENYSTDLKVEDRIEATCTEPKIVRIEGYDYDIQLVIPKAHNPFEYVNKDLKVEIRQISKSQKICQVKFIGFVKEN